MEEQSAPPTHGFDRLSAMRGETNANRVTRALWITLAAAALALSACSSSKPANTGHPATTGGSTPVTTPAPGGTGTSPCTIPQNNGGDHDADNNGGPNDGDGCDV